MLMPSRTKYRKAQKGGKKICGAAGSGSTLAFGNFGLKALGAGRLKSNQIEAARRCLSRTMKRAGKVWIRVFPHIPVTEKAIGTRMGKGKGAVDYWMCRVKPGLILFEVDGVADSVATEALEQSANKLSFRTKIVKLN
ncbi:MAG: 50S ribosomal protein L16 [Rickettsiales bacterium]|jgi:large subunit ribosomal protein L16|nr:50S ribosomal protein L16 [Rickettsiales bacterium]